MRLLVLGLAAALTACAPLDSVRRLDSGDTADTDPSDSSDTDPSDSDGPRCQSDVDEDGICDDQDRCDGGDDALDADEDGVPDACDDCLGDDAEGDDDEDGVCNDRDVCPGKNDKRDADTDGVPDACDQCQGDDATGDSDADAVCADGDQCLGNDATGDSDGDGRCADVDACPGFDDAVDSDADGVPLGCDACLGDDATGDNDVDGVCADVDLCRGDDATEDTDDDKVCGDQDACPGFDDAVDSDADGVPLGCDACLGDDDAGDTDADGRCADRDACLGEDASGDRDEDGLCDDKDHWYPSTSQHLDVNGVHDRFCAVRPDGQVACAGINTSGAGEPPEDLVAIAVATSTLWGGQGRISDQSWALDASGQPVCWGDCGPVTTPSLPAPGVALTIRHAIVDLQGGLGGYQQICALDTLGDVTCWWPYDSTESVLGPSPVPVARALRLESSRVAEDPAASGGLSLTSYGCWIDTEGGVGCPPLLGLDLSPLGPGPFLDVSSNFAGDSRVCALGADHIVRCIADAPADAVWTDDPVDELFNRLLISGFGTCLGIEPEPGGEPEWFCKSTTHLGGTMPLPGVAAVVLAQDNQCLLPSAGAPQCLGSDRWMVQAAQLVRDSVANTDLAVAPGRLAPLCVARTDVGVRCSGNAFAAFNGGYVEQDILGRGPLVGTFTHLCGILRNNDVGLEGPVCFPWDPSTQATDAISQAQTNLFDPSGIFGPGDLTATATDVIYRGPTGVLTGFGADPSALIPEPAPTVRSVAANGTSLCWVDQPGGYLGCASGAPEGWPEDGGYQQVSLGAAHGCAQASGPLSEISCWGLVYSAGVPSPAPDLPGMWSGLVRMKSGAQNTCAAEVGSPVSCAGAAFDDPLPDDLIEPYDITGYRVCATVVGERVGIRCVDRDHFPEFYGSFSP